MYEFRVTKYNPKFRDNDGIFLKDEWTCPSEVNCNFDGKRFTKEEYLNIEAQYINAILAFMEFNKLDHLRIVDLEVENLKKDLRKRSNRGMIESEFKKIKLYEDKSLNIKDLKIVLKMILRNFIWCRLEIHNRFFAYFGWDFYMYVGCVNCYNNTVNRIENNGLFVEDFKSPYYPDEKERTINISKKNSTSVDEVITIKGLNVEEIKAALKLSSEHPGNHIFEITPENSYLFENHIEFNFNKFTYQLRTDVRT